MTTAKTTPSRGNRSTGDVYKYTSLLIKGYTHQQIGDRFGVSGNAVCKALKAAGFPKTSRQVLALFPEGCTPTDAAVLRAANHSLAIENEHLKAKLRAIQSAISGLI